MTEYYLYTFQIQHVVYQSLLSPKHAREGVQKLIKGQKKEEKGLTRGEIDDRITTLFPGGDRERGPKIPQKNLKKVCEKA